MEYKETVEFKVPKELERRLDGDARLKKAFAALTPGWQRAYLLYFAGAKQRLRILFFLCEQKISGRGGID